jgi:hypothetical protein
MNENQDKHSHEFFFLSNFQKDANGNAIELRDLPLENVKKLQFDFCAPEGADCALTEVFTND